MTIIGTTHRMMSNRRMRPLGMLTLNTANRLGDLRDQLQEEERQMQRTAAYNLARAELESLLAEQAKSAKSMKAKKKTPTTVR